MAETTAVAQAGEKPKKKAFSFFTDVSREMRKVSWPNRTELQDATVITLVLCLILAAFVFGVDKIFEMMIRGIFTMF